jgi:dTDP-4-amino-4,6-dideoxygalactose transaminase
MINVTKTYLPPLEEYTQYLEKIWDTHWVTNFGPLVLELEQKLRDYLGVRHIFFVSNGTIALQVAIKALGLHGDILTTPFSYVATSSSIVWEGCTPVFVDIHPRTLCMDPEKIEAAFTSETTAILATHVYGYPCDVECIKEIADRHHIKVIYDAAHAFGVRYKDTSLLNYGDISTLSFHATKLFHTGEGGAIVTNDDELAAKIEYMYNFGHKDEDSFYGVGINGKSSELHAAMGLCILPKIPELISKRRLLSNLYDDQLQGVGLTHPEYLPNTFYNYAYYPILFPSNRSLINAIKALNNKSIFPRRYFYPSLNSLNYVSHLSMPVAEDVAARIVCLPLSHYLEVSEVESIANIIRESMAA